MVVIPAFSETASVVHCWSSAVHAIAMTRMTTATRVGGGEDRLDADDGGSDEVPAGR